MPETTSLVEHNVILIVGWVKLAIEVLGATLVTVGVCVAILHLIRTLASRQSDDFAPTRLILAKYLSLALEFQLGADILGTAVSPSCCHSYRTELFPDDGNEGSGIAKAARCDGSRNDRAERFGKNFGRPVKKTIRAASNPVT